MSELPSRKIRLFAERNKTNTLLICQGPPSTIIPTHVERTAAERQARLKIIMEQRAAIEEAVGYELMLAQIGVLKDITDWRAWQERCNRADREKVAFDERMRDRINVRCRAAHEEDLRIHGRPPCPAGIRIVHKGKREAHAVPLTEEELYLNNKRPTVFMFPMVQYVCSLCHNLLSHPVSYPCKHSNCYVCIRVSLETSWECPLCEKTLTKRPIRDKDVEREIATHYGDWDGSSISYDWAGLSFPWAQRFG
ncbi:E3 ubiquitin-protein ligase TRIM39-like [Mycena venus]|uniref:E3 ubiquitin-protein ligase TRIM39-like n=1 Tax=Mycena venus TaxID=2733690 RepID=A0A8H6ZA12_9AGAR|nr:E3 ubiquitin-protein ligase TRIM39-like [Mycena venus]